MRGTWGFAALFFPALQILPLYLWPSLPRSQTIYRRIAATTAAAGAAAWVPTARRLAAAAGGSSKVGRCGGVALQAQPAKTRVGMPPPHRWRWLA
jgi:hypothetical protein